MKGHRMHNLNMEPEDRQRGPLICMKSGRLLSCGPWHFAMGFSGLSGCLAALLAAVLLLCVPAHAGESIVGGVRMELIRSSKQKTETQKALQYVTEIGFTKRSLLTEDMTYSLVWLIPRNFLPEGNRLCLTADMQIHKSSDFEYIGVIHAKDRFWISRTKNDIKIERQAWNSKQKKYVSAKLNAMAIAKPAGNYWAVTIRKAPFQKMYYPLDNLETARKLNTERKYGISICPIFYAGEEATVQKGVSGYVFFDGISLSASKNLSASFKTFNYTWFECWRNGSDWPVAKQVKTISY